MDTDEDCYRQLVEVLVFIHVNVIMMQFTDFGLGTHCYYLNLTTVFLALSTISTIIATLSNTLLHYSVEHHKSGGRTILNH